MKELFSTIQAVKKYIKKLQYRKVSIRCFKKMTRKGMNENSHKITELKKNIKAFNLNSRLINLSPVNETIL